MISGSYQTGVIVPGTSPHVVNILIKPSKKLLIKKTPTGKKLLRKARSLNFRSGIGGSASDAGQIKVKVK
jgi:hypothetical protein